MASPASPAAPTGVSVLEEKLAALQKVVQDGKGGSNAQKYDILWNVDRILSSTSKNDVAASGMQSKFFQLLFAGINQGCSPSVARVIAVIINKLVDVTQDTKQLINLLRSIHNTIIGKATPIVKNTAMEVLGLVSEKKGLSVASVFVDTANILIKQIKSNEVGTKPAAFRALKGSMVGAGASASSLYEEILKTCKSCGGDKLAEVRLAALRCAMAISKQCTWLDVLEKVVSFTVKLLEDESAAVRLEAANCLGLTLVQAQIAKQLPANATSGPSKSGIGIGGVVGSAAPLRKLPSSWDVEGILNFLSDLYLKISKKEPRAAIAHAYVRYLVDSKPQVVEKSTELIINNIMRLVVPTNKLLGTQTGDSSQGLSCIRYIMKAGLAEKLSESGQQNLIKVLCKHLSTSEDEKVDLVQIAAIHEISAQLLDLGEGGLSMGESLANTISSQLTDRQASVRLAAATCLRALSTALPKYTAQLLSQCLRNLTVIFADYDPNQPETLRGSVSALKGNAHAAAALIASVRSSQLGIPVSLLNYVMQTANSLLGSLDMSTPGLMLVRVECGWALIDALISTMGPAFIEPILPSVLSFWKTTFAIGGTQVVNEREIGIFCRTRADALSAISSLATHCPTLLNQKLLETINDFIRNTALNLPAATSNFNIDTLDSIRRLELNLLKAYHALPPSSYAPSVASLLRMVAALMLDGPTTSLLKQVLHSDDAPLGPWEQGDEGTLDQLCEPVILAHQDASLVWARDISLVEIKQQPLEMRVVDAAIRVYVLMFVSHSEKLRAQLFKHLDDSIRDTSNAAQKLTRQTNSLTAMLLVSKMLTERRLSIGKGDALTNIQRFIQKFIGEQNSAALRRAAGEALGYLCNSEGDVFASGLVRSISELIKKPSKEVNSAARAGAAFVLACIQRSIGGIMAQRHVPATVGSLHNLAQDSNPIVAMWAIHALTITTNEAGLSFSSFATPTLMLVSSLMQNEQFLSTTSSYQCLGQVVNAIIGALGPELKPGSPTMLRCEAVCAEMETHPNPLVKLESIYFKQKLVLFAPHTADLVSFLPVMTANLSSGAAVTCLKQLVQASQAAAMKAFQLGENLFLMLDRERDAVLRAELQVLITTLLDLSAPAAPILWLNLCRGVVLSASAQQDAGPAQSSQPQEDDEEVQSAVGPPAAAEAQVYVYRWYTKVFAMECVRRVMSVLKGQQAHFDLAVARQRGGNQDFLVLHLNDLVTMAFKAATSETDSLRPVGVWTLKDIVEGFANAADPDYEGHTLLEVNQAQIASALRPAFAADALPTLTAVACSVLVSYISNSSSLEVSAIRKLLTLLTAPLVELREMSYSAYNEKTITIVQLGILTALAQLHNTSISPMSPENHQKFAPLLAPSLHLLRVHWMAFLRDYAFLASTPAVPASFYKATFHNFNIKAEVAEYYHKSFPTIVQAAASLVNLPCWFDSRETDVPEQTPAKPATTTESAAASPSNSTYTTEVKEMLKESKGIHDWYIMYGLTLKSLMTNNMTPKIPVALQVFKSLMHESYLRSALFGLDSLKELLQVLAKIALTEDASIQLEVASLLLLMVDGFEPTYFTSQLAESAFHNMLALILSPLHKHLRIGLNEKSPQAQPEALPILTKALTTVAHTSRLLVSQLRAIYGPILLYAALQTIEVAHTQGDTLFPVALQALTGVAKTADSDTPEWEHVIFSSISVLLRSVNSKLNSDLSSTIDRNEVNIYNSVMAIMALVGILQEKPQQHHPEIFLALHEEVIALLQGALKASTTKLRQLPIQLTRTMIQTAAASPTTPALAFNFLRAFAPHIAMTISLDEELLLADQVKFLTIAHTIAPESQKPQVFRVLLPCLIRMLQPQAQPVPAIHTVALQLILHLASTVPQEFKEVVGSIPPDEKTALETSVRQTVAAANAIAAKTAAQTTATTAQTKTTLTFDFSKYGK